MQVSKFSATNRLVAREREAEREALRDMQGMTFIETLVIKHLSPEIMVTTGKGKEMRIRGSDIYSLTTWVKFLASIDGTNEEYCQLTDVVDELVEQYIQWLRNKYTVRYRSIKEPEHITWLTQVVYSAVRRRVLENKYAASVGDPDIFANSDVAYAVEMLMAIRGAMQAAARAINHIVDDKEDKLLRESLREEWFKEHYQKVKRIQPPQPIRDTLRALGIEGPDEEDEDEEGERDSGERYG